MDDIAVETNTNFVNAPTEKMRAIVNTSDVVNVEQAETNIMEAISLSRVA